jgi:hypothetical protein
MKIFIQLWFKILVTGIFLIEPYSLFGTYQNLYVKSRPEEKEIQVKINKNVEFLGFIYFLGYQGAELESNDETFAFNGHEITWKQWYSYGFNLYIDYKSFADSENLSEAIKYAENIWLDYFINLLLQVEDFPNAKITEEIEEKYYLRFSENDNSEEALVEASNFLDALNSYYKEVNFDQYLSENQRLYDQVIMEVKSGLPSSDFIPTLERFYQKKFENYVLIPSLTIPAGMGFGASYTSLDKTNIFNVFGAFELQQYQDTEHPNMGFENQEHIKELSTHEFGHSFVNPVIDDLDQNLISDSKMLFEPIIQQMSDQGYTTWKICLYEHFVRAGEICIAKLMGNIEQSENIEKKYIGDRSFIYLPQILEEFQEYDGGSDMSYGEIVLSIMQKMQSK